MLLYIRLVVVNLFMFLVMNSYAQAPGYLGKRLFIEGHIGPNVNFSFRESLEGDDDKFLFFKPVAKISFNWVTRRNRYIAIEADYQEFTRTKGSLLSFPNQPSLKYRVRTPSIGIGFYKTIKKSRRSLAPIGFYYGYKFSYGRSFATPTKYAITNEKFEGVERAAYHLNYKNARLNLFGFAFSSGFRTILKDKISLGYGIEFGYKLPLEIEDTLDDRSFAFFPNDHKKSNPLYLNFTAGVGILLY